jgi:protein gp37
MRMAARLQAMGHHAYQGVTRTSGGRSVWSGQIHLNVPALEVPLGWHKPRKIFVNSMSDLFQDAVPDEFIHRVWDVMAHAHWHIFQVLTKRPENMRRLTAHLPLLPNVWLGTSVESAEYADRIRQLQATTAAIRFVSFEPLLDSVGPVDLAGIHWAIIGGESGPKARPMKVKWVDEIKRQCRSDGVRFFFKQWGGTNKKAAGREYRGRTWDEFPILDFAEAAE